MTPDAAREGFQVTLDNCDREPIHIPGSIQAHGALFAFDRQQRLTHRSTNAADILGPLAPALGTPFDDTAFGRAGPLRDALAECFAADGSELATVALQVGLAGRGFEAVAHRLGERVVLELEFQPAGWQGHADGVVRGTHGLHRIKRQRTIDELMAVAVEEVRTLTGFDRVMAYRFRHDDSGEVVAEARADALEPFVGRRYPASDIPAQARRLYTINTLRHIPDVRQPTVAVEALAHEAVPLDMSHAVLRSVSPVHIEYLSNLGIGASMSISIVVHGKLWGMLACHHMTARHLPYTVRAACDVLAQVLAVHVQALLDQATARRMASAAQLRARAIEAVLHAEDGVLSLLPFADELAGAFGAQGLLLVHHEKFATWGDVAAPVARMVVEWLDRFADTPAGEPVTRHSLEGESELMRSVMGRWCGLLALRFAEPAKGWVVLLRKEQIETISWGGKPDKQYVHGPLGPRLTPRASFDIWKETVRGQAVPWNETDLQIARDMAAELVRASSIRVAEIDRARGHLLAMLTDNLGDTAESPAEASRMQRLVGQVLDASRLQSGGALGVRHEATADLGDIVSRLLDELAAAYPQAKVIRQVPRSLALKGDAPRLRQVVAALLRNARLHGAPTEAVIVQLRLSGAGVTLDVSNVAPAIPDAVAGAMFDPLTQPARAAARGGLGLDLYIARHIVQEHGGSIEYSYAEPYVVFTVTLPALPGGGEPA